MNRLKFSIALGTMLLTLSLSSGKSMPVYAADITAENNSLSIIKAEDKISELADPTEINNLYTDIVTPSPEETKTDDGTDITEDSATDNTEELAESTEGISEELPVTDSEEVTEAGNEEAVQEEETANEEVVIIQENKENKANNLSRWLGVCKSMGKKLDKNGFRYSNSGTKKSYAQAMKKSRKANCALYVSWCLQEYGVLKSGQTFYTKGSGKIHKNFKSWGSNVKVIKVNKKCKSTSLKAGDIVCWKSIRHTNIYAGRNGSGERVWYDGGKVSTKKHRNKSDFVSVGTAKAEKSLNSKKISYIIRIKGLQ